MFEITFHISIDFTKFVNGHHLCALPPFQLLLLHHILYMCMSYCICFRSFCWLVFHFVLLFFFCFYANLSIPFLIFAQQCIWKRSRTSVSELIRHFPEWDTFRLFAWNNNSFPLFFIRLCIETLCGEFLKDISHSVKHCISLVIRLLPTFSIIWWVTRTFLL